MGSTDTPVELKTKQFKLVQPLKAAPWILVTLRGITRVARETQSRQKVLSMRDTEVGISKDFNEGLLKKAVDIVVTEVGMVMLVSPLPWKRKVDSAVSEVGSTAVRREEVKPKQRLPILVTEVGMMMDGREVQPEKAALPMIFTEVGMEMETKTVQLRKAVLGMASTVVGSDTIGAHWKTGAEVGGAVRLKEGAAVDGSHVGLALGWREVGKKVEGTSVGPVEGTIEGVTEGMMEGMMEGVLEGDLDPMEGMMEGDDVDPGDGIIDGDEVGRMLALGRKDGRLDDGDDDVRKLGEAVDCLHMLV